MKGNNMSPMGLLLKGKNMLPIGSILVPVRVALLKIENKLNKFSFLKGGLA